MNIERVVTRRKCLNVGCGTKPNHSNEHDEWHNVDQLPPHIVDDPSYVQHNLLNGIPWADEIFDYVLCDNVLEHFASDDAIHLLNEMCRVLKIGGKALIVVPDARSQGAFQDPTHKSFWVPRSALYWNQYTTPYGGERVGITANFNTDCVQEIGDVKTEAFVKFFLTRRAR